MQNKLAAMFEELNPCEGRCVPVYSCSAVRANKVEAGGHFSPKTENKENDKLIFNLYESEM